MPSSFNHGYALLIGVGADLPVTVKDATGIRDILVDQQRCAYPEPQVKLLTETQAHRQGVLDGLDWLIEQTQQDIESTAIVYFSGHGGLMPDYHLVPFGYRPSDLPNTAISGVEFTDKLRAIQAKKVLVLLDCCHAGGIAEVKAPGFTKSPAPPGISQVLAAGSGRVVIASSRGDEFSYTSTPYSIFTQALREALAGYGAAERDGYAYISDIAMYVGRVVPDRTKDRQHPILKLASADNFTVAYYASGAKSPLPLSDAQTYPLPLDWVDVDMLDGYRRILHKLQANLLRVEDRMAEFYDEAAIPLDLERTREGLLKRIEAKEAEIEDHAQKTGWAKPATNPVVPTLEDVMQRLDTLEDHLGGALNGLKQGQIAIYRHISLKDQNTLSLILQELHQGRIEQAEMGNTIDAVRRAIKYVLTVNETMGEEIKQSLSEIYNSVNAGLNFQQQFELSLPVIPFLLDYKVALGGEVDLGAVWQELRRLVRR
ncbi:MAG: caspase family protein [Anaerolineae bacterium]|nr:caspase family protein [Anaerolineae bacterium]